MTDDPTRATARPTDQGALPHGRVGPADPRLDPVTQPAMPPPDEPVPDGPTVPTPSDRDAKPQRGDVAEHSRTGVLWTGLILSALVLLFLLIFILQNNTPVQINFLAATGTLPTGVALLLAAIAGLLLVAIPGGLRILQLRRATRRRR
ncbi:MAG TPA: lipopolysaccharide assembly protein LapA domain-containing protein [Pseudonocardia sp.]|nr:lipopolysaccharide assembly protein LapA domain-containing protein [Pseudonocardia sp.]